MTDWTTGQERQLIYLNGLGLSNKQIAEKMNRTSIAISQRKFKLRLVNPTPVSQAEKTLTHVSRTHLHQLKLIAKSSNSSIFRVLHSIIASHLNDQTIATPAVPPTHNDL